MKRNKIVLTICVIIMFIIFVEITVYMSESIKISELNNMYKDINILENKIALYYLDYGNLPIIQEKRIEFEENSVNSNDNEIYYEIDLNKLENLNLFFGDKKIGEKDIYIINEQSHTIYYLAGYEYKGEMIYTKNLDYKYVDLEKY